MTRRLLIFLQTFSLLLCVMTCVLWVWSYSTTQFIGWMKPNSWIGVLSMGGLLRFEWTNYSDHPAGWEHVSYPTPAGGLWTEVAARDRAGGPLRRLGFAYVRIDYDGNGRKIRNALYFPHWTAAFVFLIAPSTSIRRLFQAPRSDLNYCTVCGYDLRASPTRCPECGTAAPVRPPAVSA